MSWLTHEVSDGAHSCWNVHGLRAKYLFSPAFLRHLFLFDEYERLAIIGRYGAPHLYIGDGVNQQV